MVFCHSGSFSNVCSIRFWSRWHAELGMQPTVGRNSSTNMVILRAKIGHELGFSKPKNGGEPSLRGSKESLGSQEDRKSSALHGTGLHVDFLFNRVNESGVICSMNLPNSTKYSCIQHPHSEFSHIMWVKSNIFLWAFQGNSGQVTQMMGHWVTSWRSLTTRPSATFGRRLGRDEMPSCCDGRFNSR